jgi:hypothetical protein
MFCGKSYLLYNIYSFAPYGGYLHLNSCALVMPFTVWRAFFRVAGLVVTGAGYGPVHNVMMEIRPYTHIIAGCVAHFLWDGVI